LRLIPSPSFDEAFRFIISLAWLPLSTAFVGWFTWRNSLSALGWALAWQGYWVSKDS
jgi:hypothetical protein